MMKWQPRGRAEDSRHAVRKHQSISTAGVRCFVGGIIEALTRDRRRSNVIAGVGEQRLNSTPKSVHGDVRE